MAGHNFVVKNGLEVGPLKIFAGNGSIINSTGTTNIGTLTNLNVSGDAEISGNLTVQGNVTTLNTSTLNVEDLNITLANGAASSAAADGAGITIDGAGATFNYAHASTSWVSNKSILPSANLTGNIGSSTTWWNTFFGVSTQARYADLAENYRADSNYEPGTVLAFGGAYEVTVAGEETDRVAGVVSTNPAHLMNGALRGSDVVPLALQGRVPCKVVGNVRKGDMMVAAGFGYAKASSAPKIGTVIGKALENHDRDKGAIEIVVGRL
jgi:hypothetical protein